MARITSDNDRIYNGNYNIYQDPEKYKNLNISKRQTYSGNYKYPDSGHRIPIPIGEQTCHIQETKIISNNNIKKAYYNLADGSQMVAKSDGLYYKKILCRANKNKPWNLVAYNRGHFSFVDPNFKFPEFAPIELMEEFVGNFWGKNKPLKGIDFGMFNYKGESIGLTKGECTQLKNKILSLLKYV